MRRVHPWKRFINTVETGLFGGNLNFIAINCLKLVLSRSTVGCLSQPCHLAAVKQSRDYRKEKGGRIPRHRLAVCFEGQGQGIEPCTSVFNGSCAFALTHVWPWPIPGVYHSATLPPICLLPVQVAHLPCGFITAGTSHPRATS